ncbi:MAG: nuclear transport factor 2 family protein, partial [Pseudomonadales bacterium]
AHLAEDVYCDWPYLPAPGLSESMTGKDNLRSFFEGGMSAFEPYKYKFTAIHAALDPNKLIAEYYSDSRHLSTGHPYGNKYISIFKFSDGKITYWREYLNPLPIHEVLQASRELQQTD